jgi:uncharacterized membrane protein
MNDAITPAAEYVHIGRRNNSLSRSGRLLALGWLTGVSLGVGLGFGVVAGAWPVLPFAGLEAAALWLAFRHIEKHCSDYERVAIRGGSVRVDIVEGRVVRHYELNRHWSQVVCDRDGMHLALRSHGKEVEIGRHLRAEQRIEFAGELKRALRSIL